MHHQLNQWLKELNEEVEITSSNDINEEARANMFSFGCNENSLETWGKESLCEFLDACSEIYSSKCNRVEMVFYVWLDEMASQFRVSAVSQKHEKLPFGCKLNLVNLSSLADSILSLDSGQYTNGSLNIWQKNITRKSR